MKDTSKLLDKKFVLVVNETEHELTLWINGDVADTISLDDCRIQHRRTGLPYCFKEDK